MVLKREKKFSLWLSSSVAGKDEEEKGEKGGGRGGVNEGILTSPSTGKRKETDCRGRRSCKEYF